MRLATWRLAVDGTTRASLIWTGILGWTRAPARRKLALRAVLLHRLAGLGQGRISRARRRWREPGEPSVNYIIGGGVGKREHGCRMLHRTTRDRGTKGRDRQGRVESRLGDV
jgi:hypothetical protein